MAQPNLSVVTNNKEHLTSLTSMGHSNLTVVRESVENKEALVLLCNHLHSYLDINELIKAFSEEINPAFNLDDLIYHMPEDNTVINNKGRHFISYNLQFNQQNLGELFLIRRKRFNEQDGTYIEKYLIALLPALFNALKYHKALAEAQTDPLTGALNRLGMEKSFQREIELARRNSDELSLLIFDVDHFKKVNDVYGHDIGDVVLKDMSKLIKISIRNTDVFARFGGEEFVVLLNNTHRSGALLLAEKIRKCIEKHTCEIDEHKIRFTASIGVTSLNQRDNRDSLFKRADNALYQAKNNGRNRVVLN